MKTFLIGHDGSPEAERALDFAAELAGKVGARLLITSVVPLYVVPIDLPSAVSSRLTEEHVTWAQSLLAREAKRVAPRGVPVDTRLVLGFPAAMLCEIADADPEIELVVVGHAGGSGVTRALLGSTARRVAHGCKKRVLVVR